MKLSTQSPVYPLKDLKILDEVREIFYETTGLALSFHYPGEDGYDFYPQNEKNNYCEAIESTSEGITRCLKSDRDALRTARESGEYCVYTCHAGLVNAVIPLIYKGRDIGAIFTGQIFTRVQDKADFLRIYEGLRPLAIQEKNIYESFKNIKVIDHDRFLLGIKMLNFMANYIISIEDEMSLQSELYRKEREILRYENEQMRLKNDLQNLSILVLKDKVDFRTDLLGTGQQNQQKSSIVLRAQEFIQKNYKQPLTLSDVARAIYLSPNYFSTTFKEITGHNFSSYLNDLRILEGQRLLGETTLPIKQIVKQVGFEDYNYFNKVFKKAVGLPPGAYREMFGKHDA
ncbi:MAG: PocR ligand-binding domain-containing protein [Bacteroidetes bacterium]|nr:PocR ligand-binding domain-containing protein [Bacteroidota bacterium]